VKQSDAANHQRILACRQDADSFDRPRGLRIRKRTHPQQRCGVTVLFDNGLKLAPSRALSERVREVERSVCKMGQRGVAEMPPGGRGRVNLETAANGEHGLLPIVVDQRHIRQVLSHVLFDVGGGRRSLILVPVAELGQAQEVGFSIHGQLDSVGRPRLLSGAENHPGPLLGTFRTEQKRDATEDALSRRHADETVLRGLFTEGLCPLAGPEISRGSGEMVAQVDWCEFGSFDPFRPTGGAR
jgi:hypothetical protein